LKEQIGKFIERKERNAERKTSACQITSFISAMSENEHFLLFGISTKIMSEKYSFECVKFYTSCFCLRQVATGHFVDLTPLGIFFLSKNLKIRFSDHFCCGTGSSHRAL
jgi:hypothetical protein